MNDENQMSREAIVGLYQAMSTLRAVRRLRADPIPSEVLRRVFTAATWAPTGANTQPWRIIAVTETELKRSLQALYAPQWKKYTEGFQHRLAKLDEAEKEKQQRSLDAGTYLADHFHETPVIAVVCFNPDQMAITDFSLDRVSVVGGGSVYPAVENLLLACRAEGLGCVLTTLLCLKESEVIELLGIPDGWYTAAAIPIGYPVRGGHGPIRRRALEKLVFENRFGVPLSSEQTA